MGRLEENSWDSTRMLVLKVTDKLSNLVASGLTCWAVLPSPTIYLGFEIRCRYTSQAGIELVIPPALVSQLLWLQVCTAMPSFPDYFLKPLIKNVSSCAMTQLVEDLPRKGQCRHCPQTPSHALQISCSLLSSVGTGVVSWYDILSVMITGLHWGVTKGWVIMRYSGCDWRSFLFTRSLGTESQAWTLALLCWGLVISCSLRSPKWEKVLEGERTWGSNPCVPVGLEILLQGLEFWLPVWPGTCSPTFLALTHPLPPPLRMFPHLQNEGVVLDHISGPFKFEKVMILPPSHPLTLPPGLLIASGKMRKNVCSLAPAPNTEWSGSTDHWCQDWGTLFREGETEGKGLKGKCVNALETRQMTMEKRKKESGRRQMHGQGLQRENRSCWDGMDVLATCSQFGWIDFKLLASEQNDTKRCYSLHV